MTDTKNIAVRDRKRYLWVLGTVAPASALFPAQLVHLTGFELFWWIGPILVLVAIPLLDLAVGRDSGNMSEQDYAVLSDDHYYRWCTYLFLPIQFAGLVIAGHLWASPALSLIDKLGLTATLGIVSGIGINTAHELGHRAEHLERRLAKIALAQSGYGHFYVEHNRGHHVRVATPADPASARFGESLWEFLPRSIFGGFRSALALERERLSRKGKRWFSRDNNLLQAWSLTVVLFGSMILVFGYVIVPFLVMQAVIGVGLLETVNYLEHYGLKRARRADGRYERCSARDSWNSDRLVTNVLLFHLQRHSDHHANPGRRYQTLRSAEEAPQLPYGYATMMVLACIPPLWRAVMDHRVLEHYGGDITLVNVRPRA
ncbi:alkane 1-monooxygenase [Nocardia macrotermitis]|uniref:Alkane 1-monooxygenase n=1 Tax=Nocardia macrotermitis TaxID=2585198 RepID=A0A7K0DCP3_9NOCA|nr:alkane 1-monooxygenase [Nocardia macrotermitis]MQY23556.1 Alkane 1-monooxygenase [Nocardia macrotermitis]